tara:strand:- start:2622 stop:3074 length:453 start_codon:yes stop_codon:yes gene_type:complete
MGEFAKLADLQARLPSRKITSKSAPSSVDCENWIEEAEVLLTSALSSAGVKSITPNSSTAPVLRAWVCDYAESRVLQSYASAGGTESTVGKDLLEKFNARLDDIVANATRYSMFFGSAENATPSKLRSNVTDTDATVKNYDPKFSVDSEF